MTRMTTRMTRFGIIPRAIRWNTTASCGSLGQQQQQRQVLRTFSSGTGSGTGSGSKSNKNELDPDKIKGPGGLTMTQIGKLVQESRARDLEHLAKKKTQQPTSSSSSSSFSKGSK